MLDLEIVPERSLGCDAWEFVLGKTSRMFISNVRHLRCISMGCRLRNGVFIGYRSLDTRPGSTQGQYWPGHRRSTLIFFAKCHGQAFVFTGFCLFFLQAVLTVKSFGLRCFRNNFTTNVCVGVSCILKIDFLNKKIINTKMKNKNIKTHFSPSSEIRLSNCILFISLKYALVFLKIRGSLFLYYFEAAEVYF